MGQLCASKAKFIYLQTLTDKDKKTLGIPGSQGNTEGTMMECDCAMLITGTDFAYFRSIFPCTDELPSSEAFTGRLCITMSCTSEKTKHDTHQYALEVGPNDILPAFEDSSGAPMEMISPLGYQVGWISVIFLVRRNMILLLYNGAHGPLNKEYQRDDWDRGFLYS